MIAYAVLSPWAWLTVLLVFGVTALLGGWLLKQRRTDWTVRRRMVTAALPGPTLCLVVGGILAVLGLTPSEDDWGPLVAAAMVQLAVVLGLVAFVLGLIMAGLVEVAGRRP
ncbi:hypothetical protein [Sphingomonas sp. LHG3406-1]|uniref:hypothetical protein n=1 Tax=Sphingomonas sp. LHG3406-1 TaxID=2804617 RepID=UPI0026297B8A|nr:hypothetical protein [Sphingomonas sp. LHG3406-1]